MSRRSELTPPIRTGQYGQRFPNRVVVCRAEPGTWTVWRGLDRIGTDYPTVTDAYRVAASAASHRSAAA